MNTPSHVILNLAALGRSLPPSLTWPIAIGAMLPDVPIFLFYAWAKFLARLPESEIWSKTYFESGWQVMFAISHSIPIALVGMTIAYGLKNLMGMAFFSSMVMHSLLDLPVHHDDAHRHFYPLSNFRFVSPVSYWDRNHYGAIIAILELILVAIATVVLLRRGQPTWGAALLLATNALYTVGYVVMYRSQG